nr:sigma-70 family RNA polymerase sigma factor [Anaerolineae bacterium]
MATTEQDSLLNLIEKARAGNEQACEALYRQHVQMVYRLACGVLLNEKDAEEVVQDSFAYVFRTLDRYDPSLSAFKTWLYTITMSRCRNKRRRKWLPTVRLADLGDIVRGKGQQPDMLAEQAGVQAAVLEALGRLNPKLRVAVVLRYFDGLTYREMADVLRCPQKTAESRVRLAHKALYNLLVDQRDSLLESVFRHE